jgi:type IV pilus assembly protein PilW
MLDMDASQPPTTNTILMASGATLVNVASVAGFVATGGELVLITDGTFADLFETSAAAGNVLTFGGGYSYNAVSHSGYGVGPPAATVSKARFARYFIDATTDPAHPTLMVDRMGGQTPQPVADDIEDVQLTYGLDTNADGVVDTWTASPSVAQVAQVRQVRLQLLARTRIPDTNWSETRPALGNHAAGTTADGYRRRIVDVVIDVRNSGV